MANYPALLLRKKSTLYPEGRTSYRFKRELRKKVTIIGKTMFGPNAVKKGQPAVICEADMKETDQDGDDSPSEERKE